MQITFFEAKPRGRADAPPGLSIRQKGQVTLNTAAVKLLEAEAGDAATLGYDEEGKRWLLVHWSEGQTGQPELRIAGANAKTSLRFQAQAPCLGFYTKLPAKERERSSVACTVQGEPIQDAQYPGACFYVLTLPANFGPAPVASTTTTKQPGVGRGKYDRTQAGKGGKRG